MKTDFCKMQEYEVILYLNYLSIKFRFDSAVNDWIKPFDERYGNLIIMCVSLMNKQENLATICGSLTMLNLWKIRKMAYNPSESLENLDTYNISITIYLEMTIFCVI